MSLKYPAKLPAICPAMGTAVIIEAIVTCIEDCALLDAGHYQSTKTLAKDHGVPSGTVQFSRIVLAHISMTFL
jgi:hypothetical protein